MTAPRAVAVLVLAVLVVFGPLRAAQADSKIDGLVTGYDKEANACRIRRTGLTKVLFGGTALARDELEANASDDALAADLDKLKAALATVQAYCDELAATLDLLRADPKATYKSLEHQIDDHDNKIRALRRSSQHAIDDTASIVSRLIPRINARVGAADAPPARTATQFPSGRTVKLLALPGTWKVYGDRDNDVAEYSEGDATLSIGARHVASGACDEPQKWVTARASGQSLETEAPKDATKREAWRLPWLAGATWRQSYATGDRFRQLECVPGKAGDVIVTLDEPDKARSERDVTDVATQMLAGQLAGAAGATSEPPAH
jgi:hypothetical protein